MIPDLLTPGDVARVTGQALATLTSWRCRRVGPPFIKIGRKIFYKADSLQQWINSREQLTQNEPTTKKREMALPILGGGKDVDRRHRLGGHKTKSGRCADQRGGSPE